MRELWTLNKYFVRYKWHFLLGILFVSSSNYFKVKVPQEIRKALDFVKEALSNPEELDAELLREALLSFALIVIGLALLMGVLMYFMRQTIIVMSRLIEYDLRKDLFDHYQKLDLQFYKENRTGDIMSRISEDVSKVRMYLGPAVLYGINLTSLTVFVIYSMISVSPKLTLYTLLPLPFLSISIYYVSTIIHRKSGRIQAQLSRITSSSQEIYSGIAVVKSYVQQNSFFKYFDDESAEYKSRSLELARVNALFYPLMILLISSSTVLTIYIGGLEVTKGNLTFGNIAEFVIYVNYLTWPFTAVGWVASTIQQAEASQERINSFLNRAPKILSNNQEGSKISDGSIEFIDVSFTYPETGVKAIDNLSFTLKRGEKLAVIGKTASGKSTLAELLLRTYNIDSGSIKLGGIDIKKLSITQIRNHIGYAPQEVFLFSDTVAGNISFGKQDATQKEIAQMASNAAVHKDIIKLENGYETKVGERGVTLSGGQKQRISLARALIKNPKILILDDTLSAVDTQTERKILGYLQSALKYKTAIIITHRIHASLKFDKIVVLDNGRKIEEGTHDELLDNKGYYYDIYMKEEHL